MLRGLKTTGALDDADKVARAIWVSTRQAVNNLNAVGEVCNANVTLFRCQEVINAFKSNLPEDSLRKLETPFDSPDLVDDDLFKQVLKETREARHDDFLLEPVRQTSVSLSALLLSLPQWQCGRWWSTTQVPQELW